MTANQFWTQTSFSDGFIEKDDYFARKLGGGDFDGDGYGDLAIGVPDEDISDVIGMGRTDLLFGGSFGLSNTESQSWTQNNLSGSTSESGDFFGSSFAAGDFNNDGYDDLAIGAIGENIGTNIDVGAVNVVFGSVSGLSNAGTQISVDEIQENYDRFGETLATGDFDGDGYDDLAVGTPNEDIGTIVNAGKIDILHGSSGVLIGEQTWLDSYISGNSSKSNDFFGKSLAVGDFDDDGYDDLAIGSPGEDISTIRDAGRVDILFGSASGLSAVRGQFIEDKIKENYDRFGETLAVGDFNGDGNDDLAIGSPSEDVGTISNAGKVDINYGGSDFSTSKQTLIQSNLTESDSESYDYFGDSLAVGDFDGDGYDDLAIGASRENLGEVFDAGAVNVTYGSLSGLTDVGNQFWTQDASGISSSAAESYDRFGSSLTVEDFNGDGYDDLAIGASGEDIGSTANAGALNILYGSASGLIV